MSDLHDLSIAALQTGYRDGDFSPVDVIAALSARIEKLNPELNAFTTLALDEAALQAAKCTEAIRRGDKRPLVGIPLAIKDIIDTRGLRTTYGSQMFEHHVPSADAILVTKLKQAGAIVIGKSATHEFAWGFTTDNAHYGATRNPWDPRRVPGGSSGGSAVAVASKMVPAAIGTDTGGSIRVPAAFCGVMGIKPSFGSVDLKGVHPLAPSLDHAGPIARSPGDLKLLLRSMQADAQTQNPGGSVFCGSMRGLKVGIAADMHQPAPTIESSETFERACHLLVENGAEVKSFDDLQVVDSADIFTSIMVSESLQTHRNAGLFPARVSEYSEETVSRLRLAESVSESEYTNALKRRKEIGDVMRRRLEEVHVMISLCSGDRPPLIASLYTPSEETESEYDIRRIVLGYTALQDLTGLPACAVRAGFDADGMPVAVQFTGAMGNDDLVLDVAENFFRLSSDIQERWPL